MRGQDGQGEELGNSIGSVGLKGSPPKENCEADFFFIYKINVIRIDILLLLLFYSFLESVKLKLYRKSRITYKALNFLISNFWILKNIFKNVKIYL